MKRGHLLFSFLVIAAVYFFRKIPLEYIFQAQSVQPLAKGLAKLILSVIVISGSFWVAAKYRILATSGFIKPVQSNYWMLLLPLLFPGLLLVNGSVNNCPSSFTLVAFSLTFTFTKAIMEEVVFRGLIMGYLRKYNAGKSVHYVCIYNSILFALVHLTNLETTHLISVLPQVFLAFYIGLFFSALLYRTNNVWLIGVAHGLLNFMSSKCSQFSKEEYILSEADFTFSDYLSPIVTIILLMSPILLFYWILMKTRPRSL